MASDNEASCESDPNFAVICAFMEKFGTTCGLQSIDFLELQEMLENTQEVPQELIDLHIKLLRKSRKTVSNERWEKAIIKFCHTFCVQDAWEIERFGYKKARLSSKLRVLKELLEMQFDFNARFKAEINKMSAEELRSQPLGKDKHGHAYWFQNDNNCQIRVYKEDPDEETWTLVAKDREGLASLIGDLSDGDSKVSSESAINEDDSNSLAEKPMIDTGQVDSSSDSKKTSGDSENSNESKVNISDEEVGKRERESDEEGPEAKKAKIEEAIEEPVMLVKGEGSGEDNECVNPIVGEEIEEDVMFVYGNGNGVDCQTGNEETSESSKKSESGDKSVSISESKSCNDQVPTSPVKSPYRLGTIIDTKTDNKFFSAVKSPTKKSRWDVETIIAKQEEPPKKTMFFFGPGCLQFKFGQKVPPETNDGQEVLPDKAKGDVGYRIEGEEKGETSECVQFEGLVVNHQTPIETRRKLENEESSDNLGRTKGEEQSEETREPVCVKKHAYICGVVENHAEKEAKTDENENKQFESEPDNDQKTEVAENDQSEAPVTSEKDASVLHKSDQSEALITSENDDKQEASKRDQKIETCVTSDDTLEPPFASENDQKSETVVSESDRSEAPVLSENDQKFETPATSEDYQQEPSIDQKSETYQTSETPVLSQNDQKSAALITIESDQKSDTLVLSQNEQKSENDQKSEVVLSQNDEELAAVETSENDQRSEAAVVPQTDHKSEAPVVPQTDQKSEASVTSENDQKFESYQESEAPATSENDHKHEALVESKNDQKLEAPIASENDQKFENEFEVPATSENDHKQELSNPENDQKSEEPVTFENDQKSEVSTIESQKLEETPGSSENDHKSEVSTIETQNLEEPPATSENDHKSEVSTIESQKNLEETPVTSENDQKSEVSTIESQKLEETPATSENDHKSETENEERLETSENDHKPDSPNEPKDQINENLGLINDQSVSSPEINADDNVSVGDQDYDSDNDQELESEQKSDVATDQVKSDVKTDPEPELEENRRKSVPIVDPDHDSKDLDPNTESLINRIDQKSGNKDLDKSLYQKSENLHECQDQKPANVETLVPNETAENDQKSESPPFETKESVSEAGRLIETKVDSPEVKTDLTETVENKTGPQKEEEEEEKELESTPETVKTEKSEFPTKEAIVYLKLEDKIKADDKEKEAVPAKRGRKNNSSDSVEDEKKPRTRRSTRSTKSEEEVKTAAPARRGRPRAAPKVEETECDETKKTEDESKAYEDAPRKNKAKGPEEAKPDEVDTKKIKLAEETRALRSRTKSEPDEDDVQSAVVVESSSSNHVADDAKEKPMSLATFSLDFSEAPAVAATRSGLRKRGRDSPQEEAEETAGKRQKMKAKRPVDVKMRKSIEEQKKKELVSSDDEREEKKSEEAGCSDAEKKESRKKQSLKHKNKRLLSNLGIDPKNALNFGQDEIVGVRQSRRIAQLKIKEEAERRKMEEEIVAEVYKKKKKAKKDKDKDYKVEKKKKEEEEEEADDDSGDSKKRKKKKKKKKYRKFDELNPWRSSSDSSSNEEEEMGEEEEEEDDDVLQYVSDHEFSPESDMEGDGDALPLKRARTARKESDIEEVDDCPCQKCGKSDHPEWILLCDSCDNGWHCSCLRPPLLVIPEGDWFCPPCQHASLLRKLQEKLKEYDKKLKKKEVEDRRKQRLAYVGISLNSVLPTKETENIKKRRVSRPDDDDDDADVDGDVSSEESESGSTSASETGSDSDEPIYQLRQRRQAHSYRFNDYDDLINSAIQDEMEAVKGAGNQGRGKDIATIVNAEKEEERKKEEDEPLPPVVPEEEEVEETRQVFEDDDDVQVKKKIIGRKKHRRLNALDISSADEDEDSDEDFKGTSSESEDEFDEDLGSEDSDDLDSGRRKKSGDPVRRSTRARTSRYDADFIDDGDSESDDDAPRRKKKRSIWDESESEESDRSWGRRKRKPANRSKKPPSSTSSKKKKSKKKKKQQDSDEEVYRKKKPKIKFGLDGDDDGPVRRTRGKKINYVDALGSDSDDEGVKRAPPRIESDEEYVANEDEKNSEEEAESGEEAKNAKIQIQSYTDARFVQVLPEPKLLHEDGDELNPIDQINRNVEMMDENEMEKMMEEEEYANKQLQMVALQLEKEKRRKEREAKKLEGITDAKKRARKKEFEFSGEPLVGNVDSLIVNSENNDELSEPPGVSLPLFSELGVGDMEDPAKKRRGKAKKSLEEAVANLGSVRQHDAPPFLPLAAKLHPTDLSGATNIEIAAPPQPFSQSQPTPSVITRMLQSKPGQPGYPVGTIRPKQFAAMPEREEEAHHGQYIQGAATLRPQLSSPYRQMAPGLNHYPRPQIRNPVPHIYHSHRPLDPSPSGGGTITIAEHSPGRVVSPAASSPGSNKNETPPPPPPYSRSSAPPRFPLGAGPRHVQMVPPPHLQPPRPNLSPYHPGMPPQYHYGQFGQEDAMPPTMYQNSPYSESFEGQGNPSENSNSKFEEETGGEFGGLVSYFSSQREDDLES